MTDKEVCEYLAEHKIKDLTGKKFGRLEVIKFHELKNHYAYWKCCCECGNEKIIKGTSLRFGTKSCGCLQRTIAKNMQTKHGKVNTKLYSVFNKMKWRCFNQNCGDYKNYGGRGITICKEWLEDFNLFYNWAINNGYQNGLTIDRINNNGNYEPDNCRWVTKIKQSQNTRRNIMINDNGENVCLSEYCRKYKLNHAAIKGRIKMGWTLDKAINEPIRRGNYHRAAVKLHKARGEKKC